MVRLSVQIAFVTLAIAGWAPRAKAAALTPGNVLVVSQQQLIEYTRAGVAVRTVNVPNVGGPLSGLHDLMVDRNGNVQIYNGTSPAVLTQYNPTANSFSHQPDTFSVPNVLGFGGLAVAGDFVYVTDWDTGGSPGTGLVRFRVGGGPVSVITPGQYMDVTLGRDGKLYALRNDGVGSGGATVDAFDPVTGAPLGSVRLVADVSAIAVDAAGDYYTVDQDNPITHFDRTGAIVKTMPDPIGGLVDIDINAQNELVIAGHGGDVAFTTTQLDSLTSFNHRHQTDQNFVTWADPGLPVPEPSLTAPILFMGAVILRRRIRTERCAPPTAGLARFSGQ
jgi:hypothetical protein